MCVELLERVDFAFALADQDEKFEKTLGTFLVPLLLKGASPDAAVKQKVRLLKSRHGCLTRVACV